MNKKSPTKKQSKAQAKPKKRSLVDAFWRKRAIWQRILIIVATVIVFSLASLYLLSVWYRLKHQNEPLNYGVSYSADYAKSLGLDPHETLDAMINDLGIKHFRLMSYWSTIEHNKGTYDFTELDWEINRVQQSGGTVSLAIGLRQPRWPECHPPSWAKDRPVEAVYPELQKYIGAVVNRYKDNPALKSYQLENEYFLEVFGECTDYSRDRLVKEFDYVKSQDPKTPIIVSLSNNYLGIPVGKPRADEFGVSVYKRVFDKTVTHRYFEYPFTSWWYSGRAALTEIFTGRESMLHELQAEPWPPTPIVKTSIAEQDKSMDAARLQERIDYGEATGFRDIYLWGGEWWYWRKVKFNDPSLWNVVKNELNNPRN